MSLYAFPVKHDPVVLAFSWLNLHLNWSECRLEAWCPCCHSLCLYSVVPLSSSLWAPVKESSLDLSLVPVQYGDLGTMFSMSWAKSLPTHWPYNCMINLLHSVRLPVSHLYNISRAEPLALEDSVCESLAKGLIPLSSFPLGVGFFFVF